MAACAGRAKQIQRGTQHVHGIQNLVGNGKAWSKHSKACHGPNVALLIAEVLDGCKKVENQLVSFAAVGVSMDEEAVQEATATCLAADKIIQVELLDSECVLISNAHTKQSKSANRSTVG